ncbi:MAG: tetratricopeptide repeat protein [Bacteroidota bacterium]
MKHINTCILVCIALIMQLSVSADDNTDSIETLLRNSNDEEKIGILLDLFSGTYRKDLKTAEKYIIQAKELQEKTGFTEHEGKINNNFGIVEMYRSNYDKSLEYFNKAEILFVDEKDSLRLADLLNTKGLLYDDQGDFVMALENYISAYIIADKIQHMSCIAGATNNIGLIYAQQGNMQEALKYFMISGKKHRQIGHLKGLGNVLNNIALVYMHQEQTDSALFYFQDALKLWEELQDQRGTAMTCNNIGGLYAELEQYDKALGFINRSNEICQKTNDYYGIAQNLNRLAVIYIKMNMPDSAIKTINREIEIANEHGLKFVLKSAYDMLTSIFEGKNDFERAYNYMMLYSQIKDTLFNEEKSKEIGKLEAKYEMEKKIEEEKRLKEEKARIETEKESRSNNLQYSGILVFIIFLFIAVLLLVRFPESQRFMKSYIRLSEGLVFFTFLLFFEFTLVLLDPYIEAYSGGAPAIKLAFNAVLAGLIFPLHAFFEGMLKRSVLKGKRDKIRKGFSLMQESTHGGRETTGK